MKMRAVIGDSLNSTFVGGVKYENKQKIKFLYVIEQPEITNNNLEQVEKGTSVDQESHIIGRSMGYIPQKYPYTNVDQNDNNNLVTMFGKNGLIFMNYNHGGRITEDIYNYQQYGMMTVPRSDYVNAISIYKKEIWYDDSKLDSNGNPVEKEETNYHLVTNMSDSGTIFDFNVGNNRYYKYLFRFVYSGIRDGKNDVTIAEGLKEITIPIKVGWLGWTLTELHEVENADPKVYGDTKVYKASLKDVWKFKYNISPGDYQQNLSKTKQDTLSAYPKFVHGLMNSISGQVSCLLGKDVLPFDWVNTSYAYGRKSTAGKNKFDWGWQWAYNKADSCGDNSKPYYIDEKEGVIKHLDSTYANLFDSSARNNGGYVEKLWDGVNYGDLTSNKKLDLLHHWQQFCHSGNPKLLRDQLGNRYIVQVHDTSSHVEETWDRRPITISFSWTQIGNADDCQIIEEEG